MNSLKGRRILFIIAHDAFRDEEYQIPREVLQKAGAAITVASTALTPAKGKNGLVVTPDILLNDVLQTDYDAVVFVGGAGSKRYWNDPDAHSVASAFFKAGKLTTAICSAPATLAYAGLLKGRNATCFPDDKEHLMENGASYHEKEVVIDGNIITGKDYRASEQFAKAVLKELQRRG